MADRKLYFYKHSNSCVSMCEAYAAILTVELEKFKHVEGCSYGTNSDLLVPRNIGKKFKLSILDPYEVGAVTYLGEGYGVIPDEDIQHVLEGEEGYLSIGFYVFQTFDGELVITKSFDVEPLF